MKYLLGVLIILFASYADIYLFRVGIVPLQPSSLFLPLFFVIFLVTYSIKDFSKTFKSHSFKFLLFMFIISIIYSGFSKASMEIVTQKVVLHIITFLLYTFTLHFFTVESKKTVLTVMLVSLLVLGGSLLYDVMIGLDLYDKVRKGGFGENPNQAASGIKFLALGVLTLVNKNKAFRYLVVAFMVVTVFLTLSRGGMASAILILVLGTMNDWKSRFNIKVGTVIQSFIKIVFLFIVLFIALVSFSEVIKKNFPEFSRGAAGKRMDMLVGKSKVTVDEGGKSGGRAMLLIKFWNDFQDNPLGYGTGYSSDKRYNFLNTHNYYLSLAINYGFVTLLVFLFYLGYSAKISLDYDQFYYLIFLALLMFEGFVSHDIWFTRTLIIVLAFFDSRIYRNINLTTNNDQELDD